MCWKGSVITKNIIRGINVRIIFLAGFFPHDGVIESGVFLLYHDKSDGWIVRLLLLSIRRLHIVICPHDKEAEVISDRYISITNAFSRVYSRAHHGLCMRYDVMTTNIAESLNSILMDEREYPMLYILNSIAKKFAEKFRGRHTFVDGKENIFVPYVERILRDNKSMSDFLYVSNPNGVLDQYTVFGIDVTAMAWEKIDST
ncbi:hypothetical protein CQW23_09460 [Capsicum baccatum]|uniref:Uncharacterized protein n=1 Tax=Capsicum baccatum TaxID=33114 RepID=A0A2G2WWU7_CAPBA|nr:hypothetical protein CQW23_09460 [Capsicum baccatum]